MNDKSVKLAGKLFFFITIVILILLFILTIPSAHLALEEEPTFACFPISSAKEPEALQKKHEEPKLAPVQPDQDPKLETQSEPASLQPDQDLELETQTELFPLEPASFRNLQVRVNVANKGATTASNIHLEVPMLGNLDSPYQALVEETYSLEPLEIKEHSFGNRTAVFKIASLAPAETKTVVLDYLLNVTPLKADLTSYEPAAPFSAAQFSAEHSKHAEYAKHDVDPAYLLPSLKIESDHPEIIARAGEITGNLTNNLEKAEAIFEFVLTHMQYDLHSPARNHGALAALRSGSGVCEDYAALFVALCRAGGIPARLVYGYIDPQCWGGNRNIAPGTALSLKGCRHCWAGFYLEGLGWLPADPTLNIYDSNYTYFASLPQADRLAQNYADQSIQVRFQGGRLDVTWEEGLTGL